MAGEIAQSFVRYTTSGPHISELSSRCADVLGREWHHLEDQQSAVPSGPTQRLSNDRVDAYPTTSQGSDRFARPAASGQMYQELATPSKRDTRTSLADQSRGPYRSPNGRAVLAYPMKHVAATPIHHTPKHTEHVGFDPLASGDIGDPIPIDSAPVHNTEHVRNIQEIRESILVQVQQQLNPGNLALYGVSHSTVQVYRD